MNKTIIDKNPKRRIMEISIAVIFCFYLFLYYCQEIPCTKFVLYVMNKNTNGLMDEINLKVDKITVNLRGKLHLRNVRVGKSQGLHFNNIELGFSPIKFFAGVIAISGIEIDRLRFTLAELLLFIEATKENHILVKNALKKIYVDRVNIGIKHIEAIHSEKSVVLALSNMEFFSEYHNGVFKLDAKLEKPFDGNIIASGKFKDRKMYIRSTRIYAADGVVSGKGVVDQDMVFNFTEIEFEEINLGMLNENGFFGDSNINGIMYGKCEVYGQISELNSITMAGSAIVKSLKAEGLPVQNDRIISIYMPELKKIEFEEMKFPNIIFEQNKLKLNGISAHGTPLSLNGTGNVRLKGNLSFDLTCFLTEDYYNSLNVIVKDGTTLNKDGTFSFNCKMIGDTTDQRIILSDEIFVNVLQTNINRISRSLRQMFKLDEDTTK